MKPKKKMPKPIPIRLLMNRKLALAVARVARGAGAPGRPPDPPARPGPGDPADEHDRAVEDRDAEQVRIGAAGEPGGEQLHHRVYGRAVEAGLEEAGEPEDYTAD